MIGRLPASIPPEVDRIIYMSKRGSDVKNLIGSEHDDMLSLAVKVKLDSERGLKV